MAEEVAAVSPPEVLPPPITLPAVEFSREMHGSAMKRPEDGMNGGKGAGRDEAAGAVHAADAAVRRNALAACGCRV